MKKVILLLALAASTSLSFGQVEKIKEAKKKASSETPDFEGAKVAIEAALKDESTKNTCDAWYTKGLVYYKMFEYEDNKRFELPPGTPDVNIESEASYNALLAWKVSDSLDVVESIADPKRKGKIKYRKDVVEKLAYMKSYINNQGNVLFSKSNYQGAVDAYKTFLAIPSLDMFKGSDKIVSSDSLFIFAKENLQLACMKLYSQQVENKDTVEFLKTLEYGMKEFPNNSFFLVNRIQFDIQSNNAQSAFDNINKAILLDPSNHMFYYVRGFIYSTIKTKQENAKADFLKCLELKPDYAQAVVGLGTYYFDAAEISYNRASFEIKDAKGSEIEMKKADSLYRESISYFEKARVMNYKDDSMLMRLQGMYRKLKMYDKEKGIRAARGL